MVGIAFFQEFLSEGGAKPFAMKIFIVMLISLSISAKILEVENGLRGHCHAPMWKKPVGYNKLQHVDRPKFIVSVTSRVKYKSLGSLASCQKNI